MKEYEEKTIFIKLQKIISNLGHTCTPSLLAIHICSFFIPINSPQKKCYFEGSKSVK